MRPWCSPCRTGTGTVYNLLNISYTDQLHILPCHLSSLRIAEYEISKDTVIELM